MVKRIAKPPEAARVRAAKGVSTTISSQIMLVPMTLSLIRFTYRKMARCDPQAPLMTTKLMKKAK